MGAWGTKPFENDTGLDLDDDIVQELKREIDSALATKDIDSPEVQLAHAALGILQAINQNVSINLDEEELNKWEYLVETGVTGKRWQEERESIMEIIKDLKRRS